jgi:putative endonuclease
MRTYYVYVLANKRRGTLYVGFTSDLARRVWAHKERVVEGFSKEYGLHLLVWFEVHQDPYIARTRERTLKKWKRVWKFQLVEEMNPEWRDLYRESINMGPGFRRGGKHGPRLAPGRKTWTPAFAGEGKHGPRLSPG